MKVLIAAGGTGGHVIPALEVAQALAGAEILFVGGTRGLETRLVPERGFRLESINTGALKGKNARAAMETLWRMPGALLRSSRLLDAFRPDVAYGVGAYVAGPVLLMAALKGIPVVVHEANAVPGFTNRALAPFVTRALVTQEATRRYFPAARCELTGLPVSPAFFGVRAKVHTPPYTILVTGGSQGSTRMNRAVVEALPQAGPRLRWIHQTGERDFEQVRRVHQELGANSEVQAFIRDMPAAMASADLVVARAGAATLAELAAAGRAAILVPFPHASDDHQWHNALERSRAGAALLVRDEELDGPRLLGAIDEAWPRLESLEAAVRRLAIPDATRRIVRAITGAICS